MDTTSLAHPAHPVPEEAAGEFEHVSSIVARSLPDYARRGRGLFETYREELEYLGGGRWLVPSGSESGKLYEVRVGTRSRRDSCECTGFRHHHHCSHVVCAKLAHKRSAVCDGCGERRWWKNLTEVHEEHDVLAWFVGDRICSTCIRAGLWA